MISRHRIAFYCLLLFPLLVILAALLLLPYPAEAHRKAPTTTGDVVGIPFEEFWAKVLEEGTKWAGNRLMVRRIVSLPVQGFDGHSGLSPVWEAQIVRCLDRRGQEGIEKPVVNRVCRGRLTTVRMVERGIAGHDAGVHLGKDTSFRSFAISTERIMVGARQAERAANDHRRHRPTETDNYTYELRADHHNDRPLWIIKRTCGYRGNLEGRCVPGDHWIVKVDAETGKIVR